MTPHFDDRPTRILTAASRLIAHYGYAKTTMEDIARGAGVSKGSLYLEWQGKEQLFDALLIYEMKHLLVDYRERMDQDPQGGQIANMYRHSLLALKNSPLMSALYTHDSRVLGDYIRRQDVQRYTSRLMFEKSFIQQMQSAGLLRSDISPEVMAHLFIVITLGFINVNAILPADEIPSLDDAAAGLAQLVQGGLACQDGEGTVGKQAVDRIIDFMLAQYDQIP